jgi:ABC-type branched-subunit amino acid transport system substrate-binding protein
MTLVALLCAAGWAGQVAEIRTLPPEQQLVRIAGDTSESAGFLRIEALLRAGRLSEASQAATSFESTRPGSALQPRARLLEASIALLKGEHGRGCQILSELSTGSDRGAASEARNVLRDWIRSGKLPASEIVRLPYLDPSLDDSTLQAASQAIPARALLVVLPQSGPYAQIGRRMARGVQLAASEPGVATVVVDEPTDPVQAALLVRGVLRVFRPRAVVGPLLSNTATSVALEMARIAPDIPVVLPAATSPGVASLDPAAWQANITTGVQGATAARMVRECLGASEAYLLWPKGEFGEAVAEGFRQEFGRHSGRIAWQREYTGGTTDFRPQLEALRRSAQELARLRGEDTANPAPVVFVPSENPSEALALAAQASQMGMRPKWVGASGWHSRQFLVETSGRMDGALLVTDNIPDETRPAWKTLVARWKSVEGDPPDRLAALGWDAGRLSLLPRIPATFEGAQGEIRFDPSTRENLGAGRLRVDKGAFVPAVCPVP